MQELISRIKKGNPIMKYDFDTVVNRRNTDSLKWNVAENELPMWVADMDFKTAPEITEAIKAKADLGVYGYTEISKDWYDAYTGWWERRHNFRMEDDWLMFVTGVIPAISSSVRKLTTPAENVVIMTPVYNIFFNSILNNGRNVLQSQCKDFNAFAILVFAVFCNELIDTGFDFFDEDLHFGFVFVLMIFVFSSFSHIFRSAQMPHAFVHMESDC